MSRLPPPPFPGGVAPKFGSEKVSHYTGVSQVQLRVSRYTVQLRLRCCFPGSLVKSKDRERKISPKFFRPKFFLGRPRGMSVPKCLFFQDLEGLTEVFGRMSAGISGQKLPLRAEFSFLKGRSEEWSGKRAWGPRKEFISSRTSANPECTGALWGCTGAKHSQRTSAPPIGH